MPLGHIFLLFPKGFLGKFEEMSALGFLVNCLVLNGGIQYHAIDDSFAKRMIPPSKCWEASLKTLVVGGNWLAWTFYFLPTLHLPIHFKRANLGERHASKCRQPSG